MYMLYIFFKYVSIYKCFVLKIYIYLGRFKIIYYCIYLFLVYNEECLNVYNENLFEFFNENIC